MFKLLRRGSIELSHAFSVPHNAVGMMGKHSRELPSSLLKSTPRKRFAGARTGKIGTRNDGSNVVERIRVTMVVATEQTVVRGARPGNTVTNPDRGVAPMEVFIEKMITIFLSPHGLSRVKR